MTCTLAAIGVCGESNSLDPLAQIRRVLIISSYHQGNPWNDPIVRGMQNGFRTSPVRIEADFEYMDARRHPEPWHAELFIRYLHDKIADSIPAVIVTADDPALRLVLKHRGTLLPAVPVVFCGVNDFGDSSAYVTEHKAERPWLAGVLERSDVDETVDAALGLHPGTREIVTVGEDMNFAVEIARRHPELHVRHIDATMQTLKDTGNQLEQVKAGSLVLYSPFPNDGAGHRLYMNQTTRFVAAHTHVPIYTLSWPSLGVGATGGKVADPFMQGQKAAGMAISILEGKPAAELGIESGTNLFEFDYKELQRWHIREANLPKGSVVLNRPKSLVETHPLLVITFFIFATIQTLVIAILLLQRKRRQVAEAALRKHSQQLANSNYMLEQFAYITAHDFQEPIRSVALFAELLHRGATERLDSEGQQSVAFILENSRRLHAMVRGLLKWVRSVEAPPDSKLWCDANRIWLEVLEGHRDVIERDGVSVHSGHLPSVSVHAHHMRELLCKLLENAFQHGKAPNLSVTIRSEREDNSWKVTLFNSGPPIPEALQSRVFGVFRRLDSGIPDPQQQSVGMGLAICRRIVDFYGGRIWVEGGAGEGCTFCFTIPDTPRQRARRPPRGFLQAISFSSSTNAHSDH